MPPPDVTPDPVPEPSPSWVASRLQARFDGLDADSVVGPAHADPAVLHQLTHLDHQLAVLRDQLDQAFDEVDERLDAAEARAAAAEALAGQALAQLAQLSGAAPRPPADAAEAEAASPTELRAALERLRGRLESD